MDGLQIGRIQIPAVIPTVTDSSRSGRAYGSSDCGLWSLQTRHTLKLKRQAIVMAWRWRHVKRACLTWIVWSCLILFGESDTLQSFERCASHFDADVILSFHSTCSSLCAFYAFGCIWKKGVHSQPVSTLLPSRGCRTCLFTFFLAGSKPRKVLVLHGLSEMSLTMMDCFGWMAGLEVFGLRH